ncbi:MAG: hypothetical protein ABR861_03185 [Terriglobales bacterium]
MGQLSPPKLGKPFSVWVDMGNFGKSPAFLRDTAIEMRPLVGTFPDDIQFSEPMPADLLRHRDPLFPSDVGYRKMAKITLTDEEAQQILKGEKNLYLFGIIHYTDSVDSRTIHTTKFCFYFASIEGTATTIQGQDYQNSVLVGCGGAYASAD